jgi:outer membrane protein assembly factor BamE (lipoprotein component of BamABCDE complex)
MPAVLRYATSMHLIVAIFQLSSLLSVSICVLLRSMQIPQGSILQRTAVSEQCAGAV